MLLEPLLFKSTCQIASTAVTFFSFLHRRGARVNNPSDVVAYKLSFSFKVGARARPKLGYQQEASREKTCHSKQVAMKDA